MYTAELLIEHLSNRFVLEFACGTGYWIQLLSHTTKRIVATDLLPETLFFAKQEQYKCPVSFVIADAYNLSFHDNSFNGGLANFWFSHIPKNRIDSFLTNFHRTLQPKSRFFLIDNNPQSLPDGRLISFPNDNNTYRLRTVIDGSEHCVLKNYYSKEDLVAIFGKHIKNFKKTNVYYDDYFWSVAYKVEKY